MPSCAILSVGRELLLGQTVDTNAAWLAGQLSGIGFTIRQIRTVDDDLPAIVAALRDLAAQTDALIITGGLGPTPDDLTRQAIAAAAGVELVFHEELLEHIRACFRAFNRPMTDSNRVQAYQPAGGRALHNGCGTAPGVCCRIGDCTAYAMPGVPREMKAMFESAILPELRSAPGAQVRYMKLYHLCGIGESRIGEVLRDVQPLSPESELGTAVGNGVTMVRAMAFAPTLEQAEAKVAAARDAIRQRLAEFIFGEDGETLPGCIVRLLRERGQTLALAESCTGGLAAAAIVDVPGASEVLLEGVVCYANEAKTRRLGVDKDLLVQYGAVSSQTVAALAKGARALAGADYALSISGVAGPGGGTADKPVGTVWMAVAARDGVYTLQQRFLSDRNGNRQLAVSFALNLLRRVALSLPLPEGTTHVSY